MLTLFFLLGGSEDVLKNKIGWRSISEYNFDNPKRVLVKCNNSEYDEEIAIYSKETAHWNVEEDVYLVWKPTHFFDFSCLKEL